MKIFKPLTKNPPRRGKVLVAGYISQRVVRVLRKEASDAGVTVSDILRDILSQEFGIKESSEIYSGGRPVEKEGSTTFKRRGILVGCYVSPELKEALQKQAKRNFRTLTKEFEKLICDFFNL